MTQILVFLGVWLLLVTAILTFVTRFGIRARDNDRNHESEQDWERP